jgi:hypothetical protein
MKMTDEEFKEWVREERKEQYMLDLEMERYYEAKEREREEESEDPENE